jgi:hypothetical protein
MTNRISVRMLGNCTPVIFQCAEQLLVASVSRAGAHQHYQIPASQQLLVLAETFPYQPLDAVPGHGTAGISDRNGRPKARITQRIGDRQYGHEAVSNLALGLPENPLVLGCCQQPVYAGVTRGSTRQGSEAIRQSAARVLWPAGP